MIARYLQHSEITECHQSAWIDILKIMLIIPSTYCTHQKYLLELAAMRKRVFTSITGLRIARLITKPKILLSPEVPGKCWVYPFYSSGTFLDASLSLLLGSASIFCHSPNGIVQKVSLLRTNH